VRVIRGQHKTAVDEKGRMNFPFKFREELGENFVVTASLNNKCLKVYSDEDFENLGFELQSDGRTKAEALKIIRILSTNALDAKPDKQGRIVLPAPLREYAEIDSEAVVVGLGKRAEIWNKPGSERVNSLDNITELAGIVTDSDL